MTTPQTSSPEALPWVPEIAFATRLAIVRQHLHWNAKEAALACGFPQASWRSWEVEGRRPHDLERVCQRISERTGVAYVWLMTGMRPAEPHEVRHPSEFRHWFPPGGAAPDFTCTPGVDEAIAA